MELIAFTAALIFSIGVGLAGSRLLFWALFRCMERYVHRHNSAVSHELTYEHSI